MAVASAHRAAYRERLLSGGRAQTWDRELYRHREGRVRGSSPELAPDVGGIGLTAAACGPTAGATVDWIAAGALSLLSLLLPNCFSAEGWSARRGLARG